MAAGPVRFLMGQKPLRLFGMIALSLVAATAETIGMVLISVMLGMVVGAQVTEHDLGILADLRRYFLARPSAFFLLLGATYVGRSLLGLWCNYTAFSLSVRMVDEWRLRFVRALTHVPPEAQDSRQGALFHLTMEDTGHVGVGLGAAGILLQSVLSTAMIYLSLLYVSPSVTLGLTGVAVVALGVVLWLSGRARAVAERRGLMFGETFGYIMEIFGALKQMRLFGLAGTVENGVAEHLGRLRGLQVRSSFLASSPRLVIEAVFLCGFVVMALIFLPRMGEQGVLGAMGLAVAAAVRLLPTFSAAAGTWVQVQQAWPSLQRVHRELGRLEAAAASAEQDSDASAPPFTESVRLEGVTFAYPGRDPALAEVSLELVHGQVTAIVGGSGSGKSTLVDLLCGLRVPGAGRVTIDGTDLARCSVAAWRRQLGVVLQDGLLLRGTLRENLKLLRPECSAAELEAVVDLVGLGELVREMPQGHDTLVGERGLTLSGGQRQRVALARALLREPQLLILDEATSALDVASEEHVQEGLERLRGKMTILVIAHRPSSVRRADRVYVLDHGRVVEAGTPAELIERGGFYARMCARVMPEAPPQPAAGVPD